MKAVIHRNYTAVILIRASVLLMLLQTSVIYVFTLNAKSLQYTSSNWIHFSTDDYFVGLQVMP